MPVINEKSKAVLFTIRKLGDSVVIFPDTDEFSVLLRLPKVSSFAGHSRRVLIVDDWILADGKIARLSTNQIAHLADEVHNASK
jgi:hypothetical protein